MANGFSELANLFRRANQSIAGGVSSDVRGSERPCPLFFDRGAGPYLWDVDGNRYIDYALGYGPLLLGHAPTVIGRALHDQIERGYLFGGQHLLEIQVAELLTEVIPGAELVVLTNTGSEATSEALRIARAGTGRQYVVKFEGNYHGWSDGLYANWTPRSAGSTAPLKAVPGSAGMDPDAQSHLLIAPWNDLKALADLLAEHPGDIAAVIMEPLAVNAGVIPPSPGFLEGVRQLTHDAGTFLIFDEVITGFRLALGGAQKFYGVSADLCVFGKAMAGGIGMAAITGSRSVMEVVAKGDVTHLGTFSGNPVACAAAVATISYLKTHEAEVYRGLFARGDQLAAGLRASSPELTVRSIGPVLHTAIGEPEAVQSILDRAGADVEMHSQFIETLLSHGVRATQRGLWYVSDAHTDSDIDATIVAVREAVASATLVGSA